MDGMAARDVLAKLAERIYEVHGNMKHVSTPPHGHQDTCLGDCCPWFESICSCPDIIYSSGAGASIDIRLWKTGVNFF
jgi:hypothetical protein